MNSRWVFSFILFIPCSLLAQNVRKDDIALQVITSNASGVGQILRPVAGAVITVCSAAGFGTPCTPLASVCASASDTICTQPNPFNADNNGNYGFWVAPGRYQISITAIGLTGRLITYDLPVGFVNGSGPVLATPILNQPTISSPTISGTVSGNYTNGGNVTNNGTTSFNGITTANGLLNAVGGIITTSLNTTHVFVDQLAGADNGAKYNACITQLATNGGICDGSALTPGQITTQITNTSTNKIILILPQGESWGATDPIINDGAACMGIFGQANGMTALKTNAVGNDIIKVGTTSAYDCTTIGNIAFGVHSVLTRTGAAAIHTNGGVTVQNINFPTNGTYRGIWADGNNASVHGYNIGVGNGGSQLADSNGNWQNVLQFGPVSSGTNTGSQIFGLFGGVPSVTDAFVSVDGGTDSLEITVCNLVVTGSGRLVHVQKTSGNDPTHTKFTNCTFQNSAGTSNAVQVDAGLDTEFAISSVLSGLHNLVVSAGALEWIGGEITGANQDGVQINGGQVKITAAHITNNGQTANNTYDDVLVAANVNNFSIIGNDFSSMGGIPTNKEKYGVEVKVGTSTGYHIVANDFTNANPVTGSFSDGGSGVSKEICNAGSSCNFGSSGFINGTAIQLFSSSTTCTTGAAVGSICTTPAITLPVAYADTNYRLSCTGQASTNVPVVQTYTKSNTTFTITIAALTAAAASFASYDCVVGHN